MTLARSGNKAILLALINVMESSVSMGQEASRKCCTSLHRGVCACGAAAQPSQLSGPHPYSLAALPTRLCLTPSSLRQVSPVSLFCSGPSEPEERRYIINKLSDKAWMLLAAFTAVLNRCPFFFF